MDEGRLMSAVEGPITQLGEGWWVPPHTAEAHPEILNDIEASGSPGSISASRRSVKRCF